MQGVDETLSLTNLGLENYVKESREEFLAAVRSVDINLIEPIRQTAIVGKKQKKGERAIYWEEKCSMASLYDILRKYGTKVDGNDRKMRP